MVVQKHREEDGKKFCRILQRFLCGIRHTLKVVWIFISPLINTWPSNILLMSKTTGSFKVLTKEGQLEEKFPSIKPLVVIFLLISSNQCANAKESVFWNNEICCVLWTASDFSLLLLRACHVYSSIKTHACHEEPRSPQSYQNLKCLEGLRKQGDIL